MAHHAPRLLLLDLQIFEFNGAAVHAHTGVGGFAKITAEVQVSAHDHDVTSPQIQ